MSTKTVKQPSFLKSSEPVVTEEPEVVDEETFIDDGTFPEDGAEELPEFINVISKCVIPVLLESGKLEPHQEGIATRAEYQNLTFLFERVE